MMLRTKVAAVISRGIVSRVMTSGGSCRTIPHHQLSSYTLMFGETGDPMKVLKAHQVPVPDPNNDEILVRILAAPINPAEINLMKGNYGVKAELPRVPGNEGVGIVESVGKNVNVFSPGDRVIPIKFQLGTWRTHLVSSSNDFIKINPKTPLLSAATMLINPCTAYRILTDFGAKKGDTVIQNGANSAVGQALIQIAKTMGVKTVNIVRQREDLNPLREHLMSLGADYVFTDTELRNPEMKELWDRIAKPKLAVDCLSGKSATELLRNISPGGVLVNYGGMSKQPMTVPVSALVFKEVMIKGFWLGKWKASHSMEEKKKMIDHISHLILNNDLREPLNDLVELKDYKQALEKSMRPFIGKKQIFVMDDRLLSGSID